MAAATTTTKADVQTFFEALQAAPEFDHVEYVKRLKQSMSKTIAMQRLHDYFKPEDVGQTNTLFDGIDCSEYLRDLGVATMALEMSNITDQWGFQSNVNKDAATAVYRASLAKLIPYLYGDHVNRHLNISGVSNLEQLRTNEEFIQGFQDALLMPTLERLASMHDSAVDNKYFTTTLLFVNEYFKYGPGYDMSVDIKPGDDDAHWSIVIAQWIEGLTSSDFQKTNPGVIPDPLIPSVSSVYAPGDDPTIDSLTLAQNIKQSMPEETMLWVVQDSINAFKTYSQMLVSEWEIGRQEFNDTIHAAENQTTDEGMTGSITIYGEDLALMIHENRILDIFQGDITKNYYTHPDSSSCFRPGTQVLTDMGSVNIEDLREGIRVLTMGGDVPSYGICSDEQVVHPTLLAPSKRVRLWGINDEKPFFTAQHVFHTTTGLRAVDPVGAKLENPWLEVGSLMVGHSLIHTQDGKLYRPVEVKRLHHDFADCDTLHGVHLREGLRSYHANGYLVCLNYPEITIKSLSKLLLQLDRQQRLHILSAARELKPLFDRFGATTLLDALQQQISNPDGTTKMPLSKMPGVRMTGGVEHIVRGWSLAIDNPSLYTSLPAPRLPSLEVFQGVLHVDGEYCPHAEVRGSQILWSRQVSSDSWEHGYCHFLPDLCTGIGSLVYRPDTADPKLKKDETVHHFLMKPVPRQTVGDFAAGLTATASAHIDEATSKVAVKGEPKSPVTPHPDLTVSFLPAPTYTEIDRYRVSYDAESWVDGTTVPKRPVPLFDVYTTLQGDSQTEICRIPILDQLRDALMTKTQKKFNLALPTAPELYSSVMSSDAQGNILFQFSILEPDLISRSADYYNPKHPKTLAYSNLKFTKLGIKDTLPLLFSSMRLTLSWNAQNLSGIVRDCDPAMVGFNGERHLVSGVWHNPNASLKLSKFVNGTVGTKAGSPIPVMTASHLPPSEVAARLAASSSPVPTNLDAGARELSSLMLPGNTVHEKSQELLLRTMKFHMSDDDLKNFMGESRPTEGPGDDQVPLDLGTNLDAAAQQWMKFTYIPAFIGRMISNASADTKKTWRRNLTAAEEKQIQYWWTGKGRGCLSHDSTYSRLNEIAARLAVLSVAPRLQDYLRSPLGGDTWAKALYDSQSEGPALNQIANSLSTRDLGGYNKLQKLCNILQVLQPIPKQVPAGGWTVDNEPYSQRLVAAVQGIQTDPFKMQFIRISNDPFVVDEYQWLYDAMGALAQALFSDDPNVRLSGPTADALRQDAIDLAVATGYKNLVSGDMRQLAQTQGVIVALRRLAPAVAQGIKDLSQNTRKAGTAASAAVEEALGDSVVAKALGSLKAKMAANGLMFVTTVGLFIMASYSAFTDWRYLTAEDHARLILQTMQTTLIAVDHLQEFGSAVLLKYRPKKMGDKNLPPEEENAAELDDLDQGVVDSSMQQGVREHPEELNLGDLRSRGGSVRPNDPTVMRIREARANAAREMVDEERMADSEEKVDEHERAIPEDEPPVPRTNFIEDGGEALNTVKVSGRLEVELRGLARVRAAFTVTANVIRFLLIQVGTALLVLSCIQLSQSWGHLEKWEKGFQIASIVLQATLVAVDIYALGVAVGLFSALSPFVAPILIIAGLVIMFVLIFCGSKPQPPLSPAENWIDNSGGGTPGGIIPPTGHVFCATLPTDPGPQLSWTNNTTNSNIPPNEDFTLSIMGTNNLNRDVYLDQIQLNFTSGEAADALFQGDTWTAKPYIQKAPLADTQVEIVTAPDPTAASKLDWGVEQQSITQPDSTNNTLKLVTWSVSVQQQPPPVPVQPAFNPTPLPPPQKMSEADVQHPTITHQPKSNTKDDSKSNTSTKPKQKQIPTLNPASPLTPTPAPQPDPKLYTMHFPPGTSITINMRGQSGARTKPFTMEVDESWVDDNFLPFDGNMQQWTFN